MLSKLKYFYISTFRKLCLTCRTVVDRQAKHYECSNTCRFCGHETCDAQAAYDNTPTSYISRRLYHAKKHCLLCNRYFRTDHCFNNHTAVRGDGKITCDIVKRCKRCHKLCSDKDIKPKLHSCGMVKCRICHEEVPMFTDHFCFIQVKKPFDPEDLKCQRDVYYYDIETWPIDGKITPILVVFVDSSFNVRGCCYGSKSLNVFCTKIFTEKEFEKSVFVAHNAGRFDFYMICEWMYANKYEPQNIYQGQTVLACEVKGKGMVFKDSYRFISQKLADLPEIFGLKEDVGGKTFFPHRMEYPGDDENVVLNEFPDETMYDVQNHSAEYRKDLRQYLKKMKEEGKVFNYRDMLIQYCIQDCQILARCMEKLREIMMDIGSTDPILECVTMPQTAAFIFQRNFLEPNSIALDPPHGYPGSRWYSKKAIMYLEYMSEVVLKVPVQHARNGGEKKVYGSEGRYWYVDGYVSKEQSCTGKPLVILFHGCIIHGCKECTDHKAISPVSGIKYSELYDNTEDIKSRLETEANVSVMVQWECMWKAQTLHDKETQDFVKRMTGSIPEPLDSRDAVQGGRNEPFCLFKELKGEESEKLEISYLDFQVSKKKNKEKNKSVLSQ